MKNILIKIFGNVNSHRKYQLFFNYLWPVVDFISSIYNVTGRLHFVFIWYLPLESLRVQDGSKLSAFHV